MKRLFLLLIVLLFAFANSAFALDNPWEQKLPFENATIKYQLGGTMAGTKTIYVDDYGKKTAEYSETTMKMFGMTQQQKEIIITTPDWVYTVDVMENFGSKQANPQKYMLEEFNNLSKSDQKKVLKNVDAMGVSTIEGMNGKLEKNVTTIMGYACDKVSIMGTTAYTISNSELPLKIEGNTMGIQVSQMVTSIRKGNAPYSKFNLPAGIDFEHNQAADQMMQTQAKSVMQNLLAGKHPVSAETSPQQPGYQQPGYQQQGSAPQQQDQAGQALEDDAKDVGQAARQETKDATVDEVQEGVRSIFKSIFD